MTHDKTCPRCGFSSLAHPPRPSWTAPKQPCDATAEEILSHRVLWTYEMLIDGGEQYISRMGPFTGGDTDFGEGYGVIFGDEEDAKRVCGAINERMVARMVATDESPSVA